MLVCVYKTLSFKIVETVFLAVNKGSFERSPLCAISRLFWLAVIFVLVRWAGNSRRFEIPWPNSPKRLLVFNPFCQTYRLFFLAAFLAELKHEASSPTPRTALKGEEKENSLIKLKKIRFFFFYLKLGNAFLVKLAFVFFLKWNELNCYWVNWSSIKWWSGQINLQPKENKPTFLKYFLHSIVQTLLYINPLRNFIHLFFIHLLSVIALCPLSRYMHHLLFQSVWKLILRYH